MANDGVMLWLLLAGAVLLVGLTLFAWYLARKGRAFARGDVFRASRLSRGNRLFPTQVLVTPSSVVHHTPQWIGHVEQTVHMAHVASVRIDTNLLFSDVLVETTGGAQPIHCAGHTKGDAVHMKELIERYQEQYYRQTGGAQVVP